MKNTRQEKADSVRKINVRGGGKPEEGKITWEEKILRKDIKHGEHEDRKRIVK